MPSEYDEEPYPITRRLIEEGGRTSSLRDPLDLPFPVRLLHGSADREVPLAVALRLLGHATAADMSLTIVKDADHRFSAPENLELIARTVEEILVLPGTRGHLGRNAAARAGILGRLRGAGRAAPRGSGPPPAGRAIRPGRAGGPMVVAGLRPGATAFLSLP